MQRPSRSGQRLPRGTDFRGWVTAVLKAVKIRRDLAVTIRLVGRTEGQRLNERFRRRTGPTNVLSFPAAEGTGELGDIVICLPLVRQEAELQGKQAVAHLAHLVVHGMLHLLGHDHHEPRAAKKMERVEIGIMQGLGFADPYLVPAPPGRTRSRKKS